MFSFLVGGGRGGGYKFSIGLLQLTITWYKIRHAGGQTRYYSPTGTLKQRQVKLDWFRSLCFNVQVGPSYANLFVGYVEHQFFNQYNGPKPELYGRYIDDCIGAISSSREELDQFITSVNSFHPALKYTWEISETSLAFLDIKVSIRGNVLCTSVHYKPTDSHSYLLYSSSHPSHVKNSIPYSQFLRLRRLCSDDSDFSSKSEEMCQFFEKRGYPVSVVKKRAIIAPNNLIDSHHYKRHKKIRMTEFHSPSLSILIITQSKASFLVISNYSKMIPRLVESFRNLHLFHSNATKT